MVAYRKSRLSGGPAISAWPRRAGAGPSPRAFASKWFPGKALVAMGTHVQLFYLQKITYQPTWLEHIPSTKQKLPLGFLPPP